MSQTTRVSDAADVLTLNLSGTSWNGPPLFSVSVGGARVGGEHACNAGFYQQLSEDLTLTGRWGPGPHEVVVTFLNDAGDPTADRNLWVNHALYNGTLTRVRAGLTATGDKATFAVASPTRVLDPGFQMLGVNLAGAEFGGSLGEAYAANPSVGVFGTDYTFPTPAQIDHYAGQKLNVVRLPFMWERLQPARDGPLDAAYAARIDDVVAHAGAKGVRVILDVHNYGYGYGRLVGSAETPTASFADFWSRVAARHAAAPHVVFGLMNEPNKQTPAQWLPSANAAIAAIRAAGAAQLILVPGTHYTNGASWITGGNAADFAERVVDPGANFAFEIHQYNDADHSGKNPAPVFEGIGVDRLVDVTWWAERTGRKLFLGEFGAGKQPASLAAMERQLAFARAHSNVWLGGTIWAGGPWWPADYPFLTEPVDGVASPQVQALRRFLPLAAPGPATTPETVRKTAAAVNIGVRVVASLGTLGAAEERGASVSAPAIGYTANAAAAGDATIPVRLDIHTPRYIGPVPTLTYSRAGETAAAAQLRAAMVAQGLAVDNTTA